MSNLSETIQGWVSAVLTPTMECVLMATQPFRITFPSVLGEEGHRKKKGARHRLSVFSKKQQGAVKLHSWQFLRHHNRYIVKYKREGPEDAGRADSCRSCGKT